MPFTVHNTACLTNGGLYGQPCGATAATGHCGVYARSQRSFFSHVASPNTPRSAYKPDLADGLHAVRVRWVSAHANIRVASAARRSYGEALVICFRGGAFSAVLDITLCVAGVTVLYVVLYTWYVRFRSLLDETDVPVLMVGYGFGASFVALFMQVSLISLSCASGSTVFRLHIRQVGGG